MFRRVYAGSSNNKGVPVKVTIKIDAKNPNVQKCLEAIILIVRKFQRMGVITDVKYDSK